MADSEIDTTQQVTSKDSVTSVKNPKRVAAGKAIAEKRRQACEEQKKKIAEADSIVANEQLRKAEEAARKAKEVADPPAETSTPAVESQTLTTTQWLSVISIIISVVGIYYKCEEIKKSFAKIKAPTPPPPVDVKTSIKRSAISMD